MARGKWVALSVLLAFTVWCRPVLAVIPGGIYTRGDSMTVSIDEQAWPRTIGYHLVRGISVYHGRRMPFSTGVFLPPAFFHTSSPMPILVALHNKFATGMFGMALTGEGMGRMLGRGGDDDRRQGEMVADPISLRQDAQFIGLLPQCPGGFEWENPPIVNMLCNAIALAVSHYRADDDRIYLTGFSYGASNTWRVAAQVPDRFAAIICCDGRASHDPVHDVQKLRNVAIYLEVGQWDGEFVAETQRMHQALNLMPHRNYLFRFVPGGNHFCYEAVYDDRQVWKWLLAQRRSPLRQISNQQGNKSESSSNTQ